MNNTYKKICNIGNYIELQNIDTKLLTNELIIEMIEYLQNKLNSMNNLLLCETDHSSMFMTNDIQKCITYLEIIKKKKNLIFSNT